MRKHCTRTDYAIFYSPEYTKLKQDVGGFYEELETTLDSITTEEPVIIPEDVNIRIGTQLIPGIKQQFNEDVSKSNRDLMINFCTYNGTDDSKLFLLIQR